MTNDPEVDGWRRLDETIIEKIYCGATLKFKTNDSGPHDQYQFAMALKLDGNHQLMFVSLEGQNWAHGPFPLPPESNDETGPYTVSINWLKNNLSVIAKIDDAGDVWLTEGIYPIPHV
ncbi:hypothetical protein [Gemmobacter sp. 24YEA27]|uniref:hypothetical protein n=1 Tax=Gemmobacter sp. 24YEA27 TaxID=3040672 RepID=UPI0024B35343|nr:hypothetical protein [Gemmobacter sp. 24YEA27]